MFRYLDASDQHELANSDNLLHEDRPILRTLL